MRILPITPLRREVRQVATVLVCVGALMAATAQTLVAQDALRDTATAEVRALAAELQASEPVRRATGACEMGRLGRPAEAAIPLLVELLGDGVVIPAIPCAVGRRGWSGVPVAAGAELDEWPPTSPGREAARALARLADPARDPLIAALSHTDWLVRNNAAWALGRIADRRAVEPLVDRLADERAEVRATAAGSLGRIEDGRATAPLIELLRDIETTVREVAAWALGRLEDQRALQPLVNALRDAASQVRAQAAWSLGRLEDPQAVGPLGALLTGPDPDAGVREQAAWALGRIESLIV